jgi:hypothetical protein
MVRATTRRRGTGRASERCVRVLHVLCFATQRVKVRCVEMLGRRQTECGRIPPCPCRSALATCFLYFLYEEAKSLRARGVHDTMLRVPNWVCCTG